jgi:AraC-like DNA-binding protein
MKGAPRSAAAQTYASGDVRTFVDAFVQLGLDREELLAAAGIHRGDLEDPDRRIACTAVDAMFGHAVQQRPIRNLGARMATVTPIGAFPMIDYLVISSDSVGAGLKQLARYYRLLGVPVQMMIDEERDPIRVAYEGASEAFGFEYAITLCVLHLREETADRLRVEHLAFAHRPDDPNEIERLIGSPVLVAAPWNGFSISRDAWALGFRRRDPVLRAMLEKHADAMLARLPAAGGIALEVRRALASRIAGGDVRIRDVARTLSMSVRSLQRQLAGEGLSYQQLVDLVRREAAERYLAESSLPIAEVAYLLGYAEPAAFHRAFKRWTDETPQGFRQQLRPR